MALPEEDLDALEQIESPDQPTAQQFAVHN